MEIRPEINIVESVKIFNEASRFDNKLIPIDNRDMAIADKIQSQLQPELFDNSLVEHNAGVYKYWHCPRHSFINRFGFRHATFEAQVALIAEVQHIL